MTVTLALGLAAIGQAHAVAALYRLNDSGGHNLVTSNTTERDQLVAGGWTSLGIIGYVCGTSTE